MYLNKSQRINLLSKLEILEDEIPALLKKVCEKPEIIIYGQRIMDGYGPKLKQAKNDPKKLGSIMEDIGINEIREKAEELTGDELRKALHMKGDKSHRKLDRHGLYTEANIEEYLKKFIREWNLNIEKIPELLVQVALYYKEEILMTEYVRRFHII